MHTIRSLGAVVASTALLVFVGGCGDDDDAADAPEATSAPEGDASSSLEFTAEDIVFAETEVSAAAGEIEVLLVNDGEIEHSWLIEDHEDALRLYVEAQGDTDEGSLTLEPGSYTYYCDIPGHRAAGMEGTLDAR